jgi:hypothetical protein
LDTNRLQIEINGKTKKLLCEYLLAENLKPESIGFSAQFCTPKSRQRFAADTCGNTRVLMQLYAEISVHMETH